MPVRFEIQGQAREGFRRNASRKLRREGRVPAIVYGAGKSPQAISLDHDAVTHQMNQEAFYTSILSLVVDSDTQAVVVKEVQRHPARPHVLHMDFQRIVEDEEITMHVPIHFVGEAAAKGVKEQGGVVERLLADIEISCLPKHLPAYLELDISGMELNDVLHLSDIKLPEGVASVALAHENDPPVVAVSPPRREEEEEVVAEEGEEVAAGEVPTVEAPASEDESAE